VFRSRMRRVEGLGPHRPEWKQNRNFFLRKCAQVLVGFWHVWSHQCHVGDLRLIYRQMYSKLSQDHNAWKDGLERELSQELPNEFHMTPQVLVNLFDHLHACQKIYHLFQWMCILNLVLYCQKTLQEILG